MFYLIKQKAFNGIIPTQRKKEEITRPGKCLHIAAEDKRKGDI